MRNVKFFLRTAAVVVFAALANFANAQDVARPCPVCVAIGAGATFDEIERIINSEFAAGRNPNTPTYYGGTPMHYAARHNRADVMGLLESRGTDVNATDNRNMTPFMVAALASSQKAVLTLANLGADTDAKDAGGYSSMHAAIIIQNTAMISVIAAAVSQAGDETNYAATPDGETVWHLAAALVSSSVLLQQIYESIGPTIGAPAEERTAGQLALTAGNALGVSPLMIAANVGNYEAFVFIAENSDDNTDFLLPFFHRDNLGRTVYHIVAYRDDKQIMEYIDSYIGDLYPVVNQADIIRSTVYDARDNRNWPATRFAIAQRDGFNLWAPISADSINLQYQFPSASP